MLSKISHLSLDMGDFTLLGGGGLEKCRGIDPQGCYAIIH